MRVLHPSLLAVLTFLSTVPSARSHPHDFEGWSITSAHVAVTPGKSLQLYLEGQPRVGDNWQRASTFQARIALNYNFSRNLGVYAGYAWTPILYNTEYHRDYRDEQRLWQQVLHKFELWGMQWQHRIRQEQRFIMRTDGVSHRSRYQLRGSYPLVGSKTFGLTAFDEVMVTLNGIDGGPWRGYDRNRFFIGPYWQDEHSRLEVGYVGEYLQRFGSDERWAHVIAVFASFNV